MTAIEQIFRGVLHPCDSIKPNTKEFHSAQAAAYDLSDKLEATLTPEQKKLWEGFLDNRSVMQELYALECYRQGVIFGARLAEEIFSK